MFLFSPTSVDDEKGDMQAVPVGEAPLKKELLDTNHTYILDCETELFIWVGKRSNWQDKAGALVLAEEFLTTFDRPAWTPMTRMLAGNETVLFKSKFSNWVDAHPTRDFREIEFRKQQANIAATIEQPKIDAASLHARLEKDDFVPEEDPDSGLVEVAYRVMFTLLKIIILLHETGNSDELSLNLHKIAKPVICVLLYYNPVAKIGRPGITWICGINIIFS